MIVLFLLLFNVLSQIDSAVVGVQDGDTITLRVIGINPKAGQRNGKNLRVRLLHIDCPERGKPFYMQAKKFTSDLCFGKMVSVIHQGKYDRYGRLLGEVILPNGKNLNQELVKSGLATHFKKYSSSITYAKLEFIAKKQKAGIWKE